MSGTDDLPRSDDGFGSARPDPLAASVVARLVERSLTVATCESLTGGGIAATLTSVPGASAVVRGGLVTYASDLKVSLAGVDADWVASEGVINARTAREMAVGVVRACGADVGVSCTGVAGPDPQDGHPVGEVWIAAAVLRAGDADADPHVEVRPLALTGDRWHIRTATTRAVLVLLAELLDAQT